MLSAGRNRRATETRQLERVALMTNPGEAVDEACGFQHLGSPSEDVCKRETKNIERSFLDGRLCLSQILYKSIIYITRRKQINKILLLLFQKDFFHMDHF